ncbi:uncharacterized protein LOC132628723 [Lycium barbarum]|uniref:uncharacterized protein LOC132628723 n=1 Tax=Lycium barbarum TaxID=112863 RepID=UPI00293E3150|nr:uncharacterized protein LOC132628723 [Lycium barbarum]
MVSQYQKVEWGKLVLLKGIILRHQFILWMALQRKLLTVDKVIKWGITVQTECVLCDTLLEETFDHLFFACPYSQHIWAAILTWLGVQRSIGDCNQEVNWLLQRISHSRPRACIMGFCFAAMVYHIWAERNERRFSNKQSSSLKRLKDVVVQLHIEGQNHSKWKSLWRN